MPSEAKYVLLRLFEQEFLKLFIPWWCFFYPNYFLIFTNRCFIQDQIDKAVYHHYNRVHQDLLRRLTKLLKIVL